MIIWEITRIPSIGKDDHPNWDYYHYIRQILYLFHGYSNSGLCFELVFSHNHGNKIEIYIILHGEKAVTVIDSIEALLSAAYYQFVRLNADDSNTVSKLLFKRAQTNTRAIVKREKLVTTPYMVEGFYYWSDPLIHDQSKPFDNYNSVFVRLQQCDSTSISFQLFPVTFENYEIGTLQYLKTTLAPRVQNPALGFNPNAAQEPYASPAFYAYQFYSDSAEPIFLYNIAVTSSYSENCTLLSDQLISLFRTETKNASDLQSARIHIDSRSADYSTFPFYLNKTLMEKYRDQYIWGGSITRPSPLFRFPYIVTLSEALIFCHIPYDDGKIVGISGDAFQGSNELISPRVTDPNNIKIGNLLQNQQAIGIPIKEFAKHAVIVGMPGSGKTTFAFNLLLQFFKRDVPFIAIEPTKTEYRSLLDVIPNLNVFTPGNSGVVPLIINPFIPPKGIKTELYIPSLYKAFKAAFSMQEPLDDIFLKAIRTSYVKYGWRDYSTSDDHSAKPFGLFEFILVFKQLIEDSEYSRENKGNLRSGGLFRLISLIEQNRTLFDTIHTVPIDELLSSPTIIELNSIGDEEQKALIIAMLLIGITSYIKVNHHLTDKDLEHVILLDEAHVLLGDDSSNTDKNSPQYQAVQLIENMVAEARALKTSIIVADQRPTQIGKALIANADVKVAFRLTAKNERELISNSVGMTENMEQQLAQLTCGQAFVSYNLLLSPQLVSTPSTRSESHIRGYINDDEIRNCSVFWKGKEHLLKPYQLCDYCHNECLGCNYRVRADAEYYCGLIWDIEKNEIKNTFDLLKRIESVPILLKNSLLKYPKHDKEALITCVCISLQRKGLLEKNILVRNQELVSAIRKHIKSM